MLTLTFEIGVLSAWNILLQKIKVCVTQPPGPAHWTTPLLFFVLASLDTEPAHKWPSEAGSRGGVRIGAFRREEEEEEVEGGS
ncbi:hypothetical protein LEMLEM_LOCUS11558 [Lemmus lemmus]